MSTPPSRLLIRGTILNPLSDERLQVFPNGFLLLEEAAPRAGFRIRAIGHVRELPDEWAASIPKIDLSGNLILPAFFDIHFHWVQDEVCAAPKENLLDWLENHVFPREARFCDAAYTKEKAALFAKKLHRMGTLGGAVFCSLHACSVDCALERFTGDFVAGNPLMDMNSPPYLTHETRDAFADLETLAERHGSRYAVTPRFALSTSPGLMRAAGKIARKRGLFAQTHLSESPREIANVLAMYRGIEGFEGMETYTDVYDRVGMLTERSVAAHAIHMSDDEYRLLAKRGTAVAHCPTSNAPIDELGLGSGLFDFRRAEANGVKWGFGSDIGAGPFLSMFDVMRSFVRQNRRAGICEATFTKALFRATQAGAEIMGVGERTGNFLPGKWANFIVCPFSFRAEDGMGGEEILERLTAPLDADRTRCESLVSRTFYRGRELAF